MNNIFFWLLVPYFFSGILLVFISANKKLKKSITFLTSTIGLSVSIFLFFSSANPLYLDIGLNFKIILLVEGISRSIIPFVNLFGLLVCLYSFNFIDDKEGFYYSFILWLIGFANLVLVAGDFLIFLFGWAATLVILYSLLLRYNHETAKDTLFLLGFADFLLLLGTILYMSSVGSYKFYLKNPLEIKGFLPSLSFCLLLFGALAKAGSFPFHTWIPRASEDAPSTIMAILPASLDKLLGIYFLSKICIEFFILNHWAKILLLFIGAVTVIFAVIMALLQYDLRRLLSFHAISQVGYMILGFGTGTTLGMVGGLFHMFNHSLYKSGLFLAGGGVAKKKNTYLLDKLGGLVNVMPLTFLSTLIFSLSISGVPPFNGFASKWIIYQGIITGIINANNLFDKLFYIFGLTSAMFASVLTLASFIKFLNGIFFGNKSIQNGKKNELSLFMLLPLLILAFLCIVIGLFANSFIKKIITPYFAEEINYMGVGNNSVVFILILSGIVLGLVFGFRLSKNYLRLRIDNVFIGSEIDNPLNYNFPATEFYKTIEEIRPLNRTIKIIKNQNLELNNIVQAVFNSTASIFFIFIDKLIYILTNLLGYTILGVSWILRKVHTGELNLYLLLSLVGLIVINLYLLR